MHAKAGNVLSGGVSTIASSKTDIGIIANHRTEIDIGINGLIRLQSDKVSQLNRHRHCNRIIRELDADLITAGEIDIWDRFVIAGGVSGDEIRAWDVAAACIVKIDLICSCISRDTNIPKAATHTAKCI